MTNEADQPNPSEDERNNPEIFARNYILETSQELVKGQFGQTENIKVAKVGNDSVAEFFYVQPHGIEQSHAVVLISDVRDSSQVHAEVSISIDEETMDTVIEVQIEDEDFWEGFSPGDVDDTDAREILDSIWSLRNLEEGEDTDVTSHDNNVGGAIFNNIHQLTSEDPDRIVQQIPQLPINGDTRVTIGVDRHTASGVDETWVARHFLTYEDGEYVENIITVTVLTSGGGIYEHAKETGERRRGKPTDDQLQSAVTLLMQTKTRLAELESANKEDLEAEDD